MKTDGEMLITIKSTTLDPSNIFQLYALLPNYKHKCF